jgi:hypothetical protein
VINFVHSDVEFLHTFELPAGYYSSANRILKAIERKKHRTPLQKKFDIGMNEINHKIGIAVKKNCQLTISPLLQHMLGNCAGTVYLPVLFPTIRLDPSFGEVLS